MLRTLYEKFNIYIYIIVPAFLCSVYIILLLTGNFDLNCISNYTTHKFDFILAILSVLLTVYGFMLSLPENKFRSLMRRYKYDDIINNTIVIGILSALSFILLFLLETLGVVQDLLFITVSCEVVIATVWIYRILKHIGKVDS